MCHVFDASAAAAAVAPLKRIPATTPFTPEVK